MIPIGRKTKNNIGETKMRTNEILTEVLKNFLQATDKNCKNAEKALVSYTDFYEFVEDHEDLKDAMYGFFYQMLDDYVLFKFYDTPIPALITDQKYMADFKRTTLEKARTFFNFGGIAGVN